MIDNGGQVQSENVWEFRQQSIIDENIIRYYDLDYYKYYEDDYEWCFIIHHQQMFKRKGKHCCEVLPWLNLKSEKDKQQQQQIIK